MSKKILEVRFVSLGRDWNLHYLVTHNDGNLDLKAAPFVYCYEPQTTTRFRDMGALRQNADAWIESLNSGDAPVPRIEAFGGKYEHILHYSDNRILKLSENELQALNQIIERQGSQPLEIYTPKKYEAHWKQLYPREFTDEESERGQNLATFGCNTADVRRQLQIIVHNLHQLQKTEAGTLEVWSLTVYEESA